MSKHKKHEHAPPSQPEGEEHASKHAHEDELIVVPKGRSPIVFYLTLGIMLFVLFIFTVGDEVFRACSRGAVPGTESYMRWRHPSLGEQSLTQADFIQEKRRQHAFFGLLQQGRVDLEDDDTARWIIMDALAIDAGIAITDQELQSWILRSFGSADNYKRVLSAYEDTPAEFESALRRQLRIDRYQNLLVEAADSFDPEEVLERWRGKHQQYAFDYVDLPVADVVEAARAELPSDDVLAAWYAALPAPRKQQFQRPASASAELAWLSLDGEVDGSALLAAHPPEIEDPAAHALEYYQGFSYVRFRREKPDLSKGMGPAAIYLPYEEVEEAALREAPIYDALTAWLAALRERETAGETIDLAAEAASAGLQYQRVEEMLTPEQWGEREEPWAGTYLGRSLVDAPVGLLAKAPIVEQKAFVIARVIEKQEARMPEFSEARDQVVEAWVEERAADLAREKLEGLRDAFGERPTDGTPFRPDATAERFREVVSEAGYEAQRRDWAERNPARQPEEPSAADRFFRSSQQLYLLPEDTVAEAALSPDREHAFLVRVAGVRDPEGVAMDPNEIQTLRTQQEREAATAFLTRTFRSSDWLRDRYGLWLETWEREGS